MYSDSGRKFDLFSSNLSYKLVGNLLFHQVFHQGELWYAATAFVPSFAKEYTDLLEADHRMVSVAAPYSTK